MHPSDQIRTLISAAIKLKEDDLGCFTYISHDGAPDMIIHHGEVMNGVFFKTEEGFDGPFVYEEPKSKTPEISHLQRPVALAEHFSGLPQPDKPGFWWFLRQGEKEFKLVQAKQYGSSLCLYADDGSWGGYTSDLIAEAHPGQWVFIEPPKLV